VSYEHMNPGKHHHVGRRVRFLIFDGVTAIPVAFAIPRFSLTKLYVALAVCLLLWLFERHGMPLPMAFRWIRAKIAGPRRRLRPFWRHEG